MNEHRQLHTAGGTVPKSQVKGLARLSEAGLIRQSGSGARGKKTYEITPEGLHEVRAWLQTEPDHASRNPAFLRVFFLWLMEPELAIAFLENEALVHEGKLIEFQEIEPSDAGGRRGVGIRAGARVEDPVRAGDARVERMGPSAGSRPTLSGCGRRTQPVTSNGTSLVKRAYPGDGLTKPRTHSSS